MKRSAAKGFTLVELMVTITLMGTVMMLAVPAYKNTIRSGILTSTMNEFVATLNYARSEAVKRALTVNVARTGANWENGWRVFIDTNNNNSFDDGKDTLLRVHGALTANYILRSNANFSRITFNAAGESSNAGSFVLCDNSDGLNKPQWGTAKLIIINMLGRITLAQDKNMDGIPEKIVDGKPVNITSCTDP